MVRQYKTRSTRKQVAIAMSSGARVKRHSVKWRMVPSELGQRLTAVCFKAIRQPRPTVDQHGLIEDDGG